VHQVLGDIDTAAGARKRLGTENVPHLDLEALVEERPGTSGVSAADEVAHLIAAVAKATGETPAAARWPADRLMRSRQPPSRPAAERASRVEHAGQAECVP